MIAVRLPWRLRARPSATLHEIGSAPKSELVPMILHRGRWLVNGELFAVEEPSRRLKSGSAQTAFCKGNQRWISDCTTTLFLRRITELVAQSHLARQLAGGGPEPLHQHQRHGVIKARSQPGET